MKATLFLAGVLPLLAAASPFVKRAGGPTAQPIPKSCTIENALTANSGFKPSPAFVKANQLYVANFEPTGSVAKNTKFCNEQCYGYGNGNGTECVAAFTAYNVPVPGAGMETTCQLFSSQFTSKSFVATKAGTYTNEAADNRMCPPTYGGTN